MLPSHAIESHAVAPRVAAQWKLLRARSPLVGSLKLLGGSLRSLTPSPNAIRAAPERPLRAFVPRGEPFVRLFLRQGRQGKQGGQDRRVKRSRRCI